MTDGALGLRGLDLRLGYDSSDDVLEAFYVPALARSVAYGRSVGFFRSSALSVAARGLSRFIHGGGTVRLLIGAEVTEADRDALVGAHTLDGVFAAKLASQLVAPDEIAARRLEVLAWLAREGRLDARIAIALDAAGNPLVGGGHDPYFHEKIGILRDAAGDGVAFQGSVNESATAWKRNFESFSVYTSWGVSAGHFSFWANRFEEHWAGRIKGFRVYELPEAVRLQLVSLAPDEAPAERDPEEATQVGDSTAVAHFLAAAPRLVGAEALAEATAGVGLFPHQRQVVERLAGQYPRSWLVADEVGLGKTISAGMALRRLVLTGEVRRALILAPANVIHQWQDELFEKFGLWVPRLEGRQVHGAHPDDIAPVGPDANPYEEHPLLLASSHLARRAEHQALLLAAAPYDLLVVDEAHHARRQGFQDPTRYRPSRLLQLLDRVTEANAAQAVWLLTATPMQVHPLELRDLLRHVGLSGPLEDEGSFLRYFAEVGKDEGQPTNWRWLDRMTRQSPQLPPGPDQAALLASIQTRLNAVQRARVQRFGNEQADPDQLAQELGADGRRELRAWLRHRSPVGQYVTRHSRETLKRYRRLGLLAEPLAERDVQSVAIPFTGDEQDLYDDLDDLIDRLMQAHGTRRGAGFVLTVYRRRLTSSWAAIRRTLLRRLDRERLEIDNELLEEAEDEELDTGEGTTIDDTQAVPLSDADIAQIRSFIDRIDAVSDSKFDRLRADVDAARSAGHSTIVFTQFTHTLDSLRDRLVGAYRSQLATFTGQGGREFREDEGWVGVSKRDLVEAIRSRRITVLLATDAASEGLNLQACSYLVNFDMPWNPMRVEQRIGRIDRLGQLRDEIAIRNYFVPGTVEERVYAALAKRIDSFRDLLGNLQPILGATERAFRTIFRAPRTERKAAEEQALADLVGQIDALEQGGIDLNAEDPMPMPTLPPPPVTLEQLRSLVADRFGLALDRPGQPATFDPARASRDPESWMALATYGHPVLESELARLADDEPNHRALIIRGPPGGPLAAVRSDRTPPQPLASVDLVDTLGQPVSTGEAQTLAMHLARTALSRRTERVEQVLTARRARWVEAVRREFARLVRETLAAEIAVARSEQGQELDPMTVWLDLRTDTITGWAYGETFRAQLGISVDRLMQGHAVLPAQGSIAALRRKRAETGARLIKLMSEWLSGNRPPT
jgi:Helicase conserved C-terminal domain/SNF2-related domain